MNLWRSFKRVSKAGFLGFWRNGFLSFAQILAITIALFMIASLLFFNILSNNYLSQIKDKVDVNVYFTLNVSEEDILSLKQSLENLPEVSKVEYISKEDVLKNFKEKNQDNALILRGLEEVGDNPFSAVLNIKAKEPQKYEGIAKFLEGKNALSQEGSVLVESVNYNKNKTIIDRLGKIIKVTEQVGIVISLILALAVIIISLNTTRLIIYSARDEIAVMKLVGASNLHVRGPFVVTGIMCGVVATILTSALMYPATYYASQVLQTISPDFSLHAYYLANLGPIFVMILVIGVMLGAVSSYISVKRYLNV